MKSLVLDKITPAAKRFFGVKSRLETVHQIQNALGLRFSAIEQAEREATIALFSANAPEEAVKKFDALCDATAKRKAATEVLTTVHSSIGRAHVAEIAESDESIQILRDCCIERATELEKRIQQINDDSRALADRSGIDWSEPPAVQVLRDEVEGARNAAEGCRLKLEGEDVPDLWRKVAPLIRYAAK